VSPVTAVFTYATALIQALLSCLTTRPAAALLTTPHVHLYTAVSAPLSPHSTVASFTEATFTGYAAYAVSAFSGPVFLDDGSGWALLANPLFIAGSLSAPQVIVGYWLDDGASNFYGGEQFATPVNIVNPGDYIDLTLLLPAQTPMTA
jgi:hypothetical protein